MQQNELLNGLRKVSLYLMFALGVLGIAYGLLADSQATASGTKNTLATTIISVASSALFGASLTMIIDRVLGTELMDIKTYLFRHEKFESTPESVRASSGKWHHYDLSIRDSKIIWQYIPMELRTGATESTLSGDFFNYGFGGKAQKYSIEAGIRSGSLISVMRAIDSNERDSIEIIPNIQSRNLQAHVGFQLLESWDGDLALTYTIKSREKLTEGDTVTEAESNTLLELLGTLIRRQNINILVNDDRLEEAISINTDRM